MIRSVPNSKLTAGMVLALPMGRTATITEPPKVGRRYVTFKTAEHGEVRVFLYDETLVEEPEPHTELREKRIKDRGYTVAEVDLDAGIKYRIEGTAAKLSTAWMATTDADEQHAIQTTAGVLAGSGLMSSEQHAAFLYRIGVSEHMPA